MKSIEMNPVLMTWEDYFLLRGLVPVTHSSDELSLSGELSRAILLRDDAFPPHAIRLYSQVSVQDVDLGTEHQFCVVPPEEADEATAKVSVLAPMATAIIGFRKGEAVAWPFPGGTKRLKILEVQNEATPLPKLTSAGLPLHQ